MTDQVAKPRVRVIDKYGSSMMLTYRVTDEIGTYYMSKGWNTSWSKKLTKDWRDSIRIGDVLRYGKDGFRVVRNCHYKQDGFLASVTLTIQHCSWTGRCYTLLNRSDLAWRRFRPAGVRVRLDRDLDRKIEQEIHRPHGKGLDCCEVRGIA